MAVPSAPPIPASLGNCAGSIGRAAAVDGILLFICRVPGRRTLPQRQDLTSTTDRYAILERTGGISIAPRR